MSVDGSLRKDAAGNINNGNGMVASVQSSHRLRLKPDTEHMPEEYDDLHLEFSPLLYSSLEPYLPPSMLNVPRENKVQYMREILLKYSPEGERNRLQRMKNYKAIITREYPRLHKELYGLNIDNFFVPSFLEAIKKNSEAAFRNVISEPTPGIFTFEMLQPHFCELLLSEVEHFEEFVTEANMKIMRPNTMNKYGAVVDDFGLNTMLEKLMEDYIRPLSKVFFADVGGSTLDSHHGFVVEYGIDKDVDLAFHVDDAEVSLNVCLGKQFAGGQLFFRGVRCDKHVNTETQPEEIFDYSHVPGRAILHRGRHRHGARATTTGHRINLLIWCRSSVFRELKKYQRDCSGWCGECQREKKERLRSSVSNTKMELLKRDGESAA